MTVTRVPPRGSTPSPTFFIVADAGTPSAQFAPWFALDFLSRFSASALGLAFAASYGIAAPVYRGYYLTAFPAAGYPADGAADEMLSSLPVPLDETLLTVFIPSSASDGIPAGSDVVAYHDFSRVAPYLWVPWRPEGLASLSALDTFTWALGHEWMEACTDTYPGMGTTFGGYEVGDLCEDVYTTVAGSRGYTYLAQSFAGLDGSCWQPAAAAAVTLARAEP
ncbi:MAG: hypothetical protein ACRDOE_00215, partial [Streptosporangiaceae bacterium]